MSLVAVNFVFGFFAFLSFTVDKVQSLKTDQAGQYLVI